MGEPATPSDTYRAETRALAEAVVESVRADAKMPPLVSSHRESYLSTNQVCDLEAVEDLAFRLSHELTMLREENERMRAVYDAGRRLRLTWDGPVALRTGVSYEEEIEASRAFIDAIDASLAGGKEP